MRARPDLRAGSSLFRGRFSARTVTGTGGAGAHHARGGPAPVVSAAMAGEAVTKQTERVLRLVGGVLGDGMVGAYLHGSAALGGLRPHSDLDRAVRSIWAMRTTTGTIFGR